MFESVIGQKISRSLMNKIVKEINEKKSWGHKIGFFEVAEVSDLGEEKDWRVLDSDKGKVNQKYDVRCSLRQGDITTSSMTNIVPNDLKGNEVLDFYLFQRDGKDIGDLDDNVCIKLNKYIVEEVCMTVSPKAWGK